MEVLEALRESPLNRSRIAQACNINYGRLAKTVDACLAAGWIATEVKDGHELHSLTPTGLECLIQYLKIYGQYRRGVKLTTGQEGF